MKTSHSKYHRTGKHCQMTFHSRYSYSGGADGTWTVYRPNGSIMATGLSDEEFEKNKAKFDEQWKEDVYALEAIYSQQTN